MMEAVIEVKGPSDGRIPGSDKDLGAGQVRQWGGGLDELCQSQACVRSSLWSPIKVGKRRRAVDVGRLGNRPGGWLLRARAIWEGETGEKIE